MEEMAPLLSKSDNVTPQSLFNEYVQEIENGNLYKVAQTFITAEKNIQDAHDPQTKADGYRDLSLVELALSQNKVNAKDPIAAKIYVDDGVTQLKRAEALQKDNPTDLVLEEISTRVSNSIDSMVEPKK